MGGVLMKLSRVVLAVGLLVIFAAAMSAVAKADGAPPDPVVTIGTTSKTCSGPLCDPTDGDSDTNPVVIMDDSGETDLIYSGPAVSQFFVEIIPYTGEALSTFEDEGFSCSAGAGAATCGPAAVCTQGQPDASPQCPMSGPAQEFVFDGPVNPTTGALEPFIFTGEEIAVYTPEPSVGGLLLVGLAALVCFGFRRRLTNPA